MALGREVLVFSGQVKHLEAVWNDIPVAPKRLGGCKHGVFYGTELGNGFTGMLKLAAGGGYISLFFLFFKGDEKQIVGRHHVNGGGTWGCLQTKLFHTNRQW
ncbi:hypothetical protein B0T21DRAFT_348997 [Apiosordaria backusii]|uniref:Uncharacterized protein n=1 Tax=Apiosordaria backusii TaxID=314023 RepID=A0AA40BK00_9PEZI|nr:hypothetical protein B0T21DRAFT_348997 [Apiosordaria backusii]